MDHVDRFLSRLDGHRSAGQGKWDAWCPAHPDRHDGGRRSLGVARGNNGSVLLSCRSQGCSPEEIVEALGLTMADLWPPKDNPPPAPAPAPKRKDKRRDLGDLVDTYRYTDGDSVVLFEVQRYELWKDGKRVSKDFLSRRPDGPQRDPRKPTRWAWGLGAGPDRVPTVLYRLPAVLEAVRTGQRVILVEGEKCVHALEDAAREAGRSLVATTCPTGSGKWLAIHTQALAGADVVILPDDDPPGKKTGRRPGIEHAQAVAEELAGAGAKVRIVAPPLPGLPADKKQDVYDWLVIGAQSGIPADARLDELDAIIAAAPSYQPTGKPKPAKRPTIVVRAGEIPRQVDEAEAALQGHAEIYHRSGELVVVRQDEETGVHLLAGVKRNQLLGLMAEAAKWVQISKGDEGQTIERAVDPPQKIVDVLRERSTWSKIQPCVGIVEAPTLRSDFSLLDRPGYDPVSMLVFQPGKTVWPKVPDRPTREQAADALERLYQVFSDFPFRTDADRSSLIALLITSLIRPAVPTAPMFLVVGHTRGTGKSLLCRAAHIISTGHDWSPKVGTDDSELRKQIVSTAMEGGRFFSLDNLATKLSSPVLDAALTTPFMSDRVLGQSRTAKVRLSMTFCATGNNLTIGGDLGRRVLRCYLHTDLERPEERADLKIPSLLAWIRGHRPQLVTALLTIVRACVVADPDVTVRPMGSFEAWDYLVRRPLIWLGQADPLDTQADVREEAEVDIHAWATFLYAWLEMFNGLPQPTKRVIKKLQTDEPAAERGRTALESLTSKRIDSRQLGYFLRQYKGRIVQGLRLVSLDPKASRHKDGALWRVEIADSSVVQETLKSFAHADLSTPDDGSEDGIEPIWSQREQAEMQW